MFPKDYSGHGMDDGDDNDDGHEGDDDQVKLGELSHLPKQQGVPRVRLLALYILLSLNRKKFNSLVVTSVGQDPDWFESSFVPC